MIEVLPDQSVRRNHESVRHVSWHFEKSQHSRIHLAEPSLSLFAWIGILSFVFLVKRPFRLAGCLFERPRSKNHFDLTVPCLSSSSIDCQSLNSNRCLSFLPLSTAFNWILYRQPYRALLHTSLCRWEFSLSSKLINLSSAQSRCLGKHTLTSKSAVLWIVNSPASLVWPMAKSGPKKPTTLT